MKTLALVIGMIPAIAGATFLTTSSTQAQNGTLCGNRTEIVKSLTEQFKESPQAVGVVDENAVLEIFVSASGTWTIIATGTDGNSCLVSSGEGWDSKSMVIGVDA